MEIMEHISSRSESIWRYSEGRVSVQFFGSETNVTNHEHECLCCCCTVPINIHALLPTMF